MRCNDETTNGLVEPFQMKRRIQIGEYLKQDKMPKGIDVRRNAFFELGGLLIRRDHEIWPRVFRAP